VAQKSEQIQSIYKTYLPRVYGYVAARVADVHEAEDLVSDIFLKVVKNFDQLRSETSLSAWIFTIAHHTLVNHYRRKNIHLLSYDTLDDEPAPNITLTKHEDAPMLLALLQTLSPRRQEIITLRFFGGLRNQEIAAVLGLDERTVAAHLSRGLRDLYLAFEGKPDGQ
jgi:RNA polymerase sigma-70 factor, ECF subfamily